MAKKIDRSRIEAGKYELPKKLAFLTTESVEYLSVTDRDGEFTVEMPAEAVAFLIKNRASLRAEVTRTKAKLQSLKHDHKGATKAHEEALTAESDAHATTKAALAKAERKVKSLMKAAAAAAPAPAPTAAAPAAAPAEPAKPDSTKATKAAKAPKPVKAEKPAKAPKPMKRAESVEQPPASASTPTTEHTTPATPPEVLDVAATAAVQPHVAEEPPAPPKKAAKKTAVAKAVETVMPAEEPPTALPMQ